MKKALFPGTFDPPSLGHLDIIKRASVICDKLYIGIATNLEKKRDVLFTTEERKELLHEVTKDLLYVEIISFSGLVVDFAKQQGIDFLLRGLRAFSDFEYEFRMALANRKMSGIETLFLMADAKHAHISSTLIREIGPHKDKLREFVPPTLEEKIFLRLKK